MKLHGHTKIELTNIKTGELQVIEDDNMVTNYMPDLLNKRLPFMHSLFSYNGTIKPAGSSSNSEFIVGNLMPSVMFGGVACFDRPLDEDANKYFPPSNVYATAYAGDFSTITGDKNLGVRQNYSVNLPNKSATFIWDWDTERGNGVIASVCLCPSNAGVIGYGSTTARNSVTGTQETNAFRRVADLTNDSVIDFLNNSGRQINITPVFMSVSEGILVVLCGNELLKFNLLKDNYSIFNWNHLGEYSVRFTDNVSNIPFNYDIENICYYNGAIYAVSSVNVASGSNIVLKKVEISDFSVSEISLPNNTGESVIFSSSNDSKNGKRIQITGGKLFVQTNGLHFAYIDIETRDTDFVKNPDGTIATWYNGGMTGYNLYGRYSFKFNDRILAASRVNVAFDSTYSTCYECDFITKEGVLYKNGTSVNAYDRSKPVLRETDSPLMFVYGGGENISNNVYTKFGIAYNLMGLQTINNLETPVTKTADMTMRITYTITEVE